MTWRTGGLLTLLAVVVMGACHGGAPQTPQPKASPFLGTWRFVSGRYTQPDGSLSVADSTQLQVIKVISAAHFAYVTQAGTRFVRAGAGTYRFDAATYTEHLEHSSQDSMRGNDYSFAYRLDGDTWYHVGDVNGAKLEEVYRRVK